MVISAVTLKFLVGAVVCGSLATSIAVPTVMSKNSSSWPVLNHFPESHKQKFQKNCQLIVGDESANTKSYLLACEEGGGGQAPKIYFYSEWDNPIPVKEFKEEEEKRVTVTLKESSSERDAKITDPNKSLKGLIGKSLDNCNLLKNGNEEKRWTLNCPKSDSENSQGIPLIPVIIQ